MKTVIEIVRDHLVSNGFDGLVQEDSECGCLCDDLAPCGGSISSCQPGYRGVFKEEPSEWAIYRTKEAARESVAVARTQGNQG